MSVLTAQEPVASPALDAIDRHIVRATQDGLPLVSRPYRMVGAAVGISEAEAMRRVSAMQQAGVIRRIGAVPNHYALGVHANGMSVWDLDDRRTEILGRRVGALDFVSHCYLRPRRPPVWRYNLFAMVHGRSREEVENMVSAIAKLLGDSCRAHEVLYSTRILKKSGLRLTD